jgi:RecA-family ATPase
MLLYKQEISKIFHLALKKELNCFISPEVTINYRATVYRKYQEALSSHYCVQTARCQVKLSLYANEEPRGRGI